MAATGGEKDRVPHHDSVDEAYGAGSSVAADRSKTYSAMIERYKDVFGAEDGGSSAPEFFIRA